MFFLNVQRFHIKWKNFSHLHNTDETYEFLKRYKGMKRVDNYIKSVWQAEQNLLAKGLSIEEQEAFQIEKERKNEWLEGCKIIERVVANRESENGVEYLCKWKGMIPDPIACRVRCCSSHMVISSSTLWRLYLGE